MVRGVLGGLFCLLFISLVEAQTEVVHLPQIHSLPNTDYTEAANYSKIAKSQHEISLALIREKAEYGMSEHVFGNYGEVIPAALKIFPHGIPMNFGTLNEAQKIFLAKQGALLTLLSLGYIKEVWGATTEEHWAYGDSLGEKCQKAWSNASLDNREELLQSTAQLENYSFFEREDFALKRIQNFAKNVKDPNLKVYLVYGSQHDFLRHENKHPALKIRRYKLESDSGPATYFGPVPEWGFTNVLTPDEQIRFYSLILSEHPEFNQEDRDYAQEQQKEILEMFKRLGLRISPETLSYILNLEHVASAEALVEGSRTLAEL